jgi:hypothetical protein
MIIAKLINPQIFFVDGEKTSFTNTLILEQEGAEIERRDINPPYATPDAEIEALVKQMAVDKAAELEIIQDAQDSLQWDWPLFDLPEVEME